MENIEEKLKELELKLINLNVDLIDQDLPNDIYLKKCKILFQERIKIKKEISSLEDKLILI